VVGGRGEKEGGGESEKVGEERIKKSTGERSAAVKNEGIQEKREKAVDGGGASE
jgi:hypothetical protein